MMSDFSAANSRGGDRRKTWLELDFAEKACSSPDTGQRIAGNDEHLGRRVEAVIDEHAGQTSQYGGS